MFLLDTDIVSNFRKRRPHPELQRWIAQIGWDQVFMCVMTVTEIQIGIERTRIADEAAAARITAWLEGLLENGRPQMLPVDPQAARLFARMYETPALRNFVLPQPRSKHGKTGADLVIAAVAITHGLTVVTHNTRDFEAIHGHFPLPGLFDPFDGSWKIRPRQKR